MGDQFEENIGFTMNWACNCATRRRRVEAELRDDRRAASTSKEICAMDFVHDQLATGQKIRVLTVVGTFNRFSPSSIQGSAIEPKTWLRPFEGVCAGTGYPKTIRVD
jgi:putative transposase